MEKVIVIVGPTAVGKSKLGVEIAKRFNGEIISGDSMQIYKGLDIGTAKISKKEMKGIVHHLIDIIDVSDSYSVSSFQHDCRQLINDITSRGKLPIIVGGTGLYHKAALYDYDFTSAASSDFGLMQKYESYTNEELYEELKSIDEESAKILHPNNRRRVLRALEIYYTSGKTKSEIISAQQHKPLYNILFIGLNLDRELLYKRIEDRVDEQIKQGLEEEARSLYNLHNDKVTAIQSIGYKEFIPYFEGKCSLDDVIYEIKKATKRYAKRQLTWFNHQVSVKWFTSNLANFNTTVDEVENYIKEKMNL
jgi:tRNA dimethylallyltransferase